jgi:hypothetical protein
MVRGFAPYITIFDRNIFLFQSPRFCPGFHFHSCSLSRKPCPPLLLTRPLDICKSSINVSGVNILAYLFGAGACKFSVVNNPRSLYDQMGHHSNSCISWIRGLRCFHGSIVLPLVPISRLSGHCEIEYCHEFEADEDVGSILGGGGTSGLSAISRHANHSL